ncbi:hypothetical protein BDB00DRAFT_847329 [Zychaea mexicana]|uniref:uncharacterized protein n=1 Tax=Zychaea mexicana TaxID=64656 RepID=UPI0022FE0B00|nr:uncharacterized protein BDB00DRAFT_847329 [Zychaea mexicana]KAI9488662.1 hypothetical protein BDB00DRAFT_847329 [Zychaea mexicana]
MMMPPQMSMQMPYPGMNMMMGGGPGFIPRPTAKVHINPKFAAMQQQKQQQQKQQQQQQQQQRLQQYQHMQQIQMLQQQQQFQQQQQQQQGFRPPSMSTTGDVTQDEINRQRQYLLELQKKRQTQKNTPTTTTTTTTVSSTTTAVTRGSSTNNRMESSSTSPVAQKQRLGGNEDDRGNRDNDDPKPSMTIRGLANKGITIKGAAAAATPTTTTFDPRQRSPASSRASGNMDRASSQQQQQLSKSILDRIASSSLANTAVMSHLNGANRKRPSPSFENQPSAKRTTTNTTDTIQLPTAVMGGSGHKSNKLLIKNLSDSTTEADIRQFGQSVPGGIAHVELGKQQATVTLMDPESAVLFRRKYNRTALNGSHIVISFS